MKPIFGFLLVVVLPLALTEFTELAPWLAVKLVQRAVRALPQEERERYAEEWSRELEEVPGKVTKLAWALKVAVLAPSTGREIEGLPPLWDQLSRRAGKALKHPPGARFSFRPKFREQRGDGSSRDSLTAARETVLYAIVGIVITTVAFALVNFIIVPMANLSGSPFEATANVVIFLLGAISVIMLIVGGLRYVLATGGQLH